MIAAAWLTLRIALEIALAVHCDRWAHLEVGDRCIEPRDHARGPSRRKDVPHETR